MPIDCCCCCMLPPIALRPMPCGCCCIIPIGCPPCRPRCACCCCCCCCIIVICCIELALVCCMCWCDGDKDAKALLLFALPLPPPMPVPSFGKGASTAGMLPADALLSPPVPSFPDIMACCCCRYLRLPPCRRPPCGMLPRFNVFTAPPTVLPLFILPIVPPSPFLLAPLPPSCNPDDESLLLLLPRLLPVVAPSPWPL